MIIIRVQIDLLKDNLIHNIKVIKEKCNKDIIAVVKDNAYSHGSREIVTMLKEENVKYFAVATLNEAIEIRDIAENILLFETLNIEEVKTAYNFDLVLSLTSEEYIDRLIELDLPIRCHLKIDTGMNRYGIETTEVERIVKKVKRSSLKLEGIYTHFAGEVKDDMQREYDIFENSIKNIDRRNLMIHTQKSNAVFEIEDNISTHCRVGLCLYGISNIKEHRNYLKPVMKVYAYPTRIKKVKKGETLGYNHNYIVEEDGYAVTIDYGYGDGLLTKDEIVYMLNGRIREHNRCVLCMDSMILYLDKEVSKKDEFVFLNEIISMNYFRDKYGYRACELSTKLNKRIKKNIRN